MSEKMPTLSVSLLRFDTVILLNEELQFMLHLFSLANSASIISPDPSPFQVFFASHFIEPTSRPIKGEGFILVRIVQIHLEYLLWLCFKLQDQLDMRFVHAINECDEPPNHIDFIQSEFWNAVNKHSMKVLSNTNIISSSECLPAEVTKMKFGDPYLQAR